MNILILSENVPFDAVKQKGVSAVNIQLFLVTRELSALGHKVGLLTVREGGAVVGPEDEQLSDAGEKGQFDILSPVYFNGKSLPKNNIGIVNRVMRAVALLLGAVPMREFYPAMNLGSEITKRAYRFDADILLSFLSPLAAGAMATISTYPKIIFQGDIDFGSDRIRLDHESLFRDSTASRKSQMRRRLAQYLYRRRIQRFSACHRHMSLCADALVTASANNCHYYEDIGHPKVAYVGTTWTDQPFVPAENRTSVARDGSDERPFKIIGHVGLLNMTASTFGLAYLLQEVMPALRREMQGYRFEVHIIGDGAPVEPLRRYLKQENLHLRGYVDDLDSELYDSDVFLFLNNAGPFRAIFSRQIISWAMGLCLVAHAGSRDAMPELAHGENALIGSTPEELSKLVKRACLDSELNEKLRRGGRASFKENFSPLALSKKLISLMEDVISQRG